MSRARAAFGIGIAAFCGVVTAYATLQPEFEKQRAEREGDFSHQHLEEKQAQPDNVISQAILSDLKEAKYQVEGDEKGIAWGIREAIWGKPEYGKKRAISKDDEIPKSEIKSAKG